MLLIQALMSFAGTIIKFLPPERMSDRELVDAVCSNDQRAIVHLFYKKFISTFQYHVYIHHKAGIVALHPVAHKSFPLITYRDEAVGIYLGMFEILEKSE